MHVFKRNRAAADGSPEEDNLSRSRIGDGIMKVVFLSCAVFSVVAVIAIVLYILAASIPAFREIGFLKFLFGMRWKPSAGDYGIFPMIVGSIYATAGAILVGGSFGIFGAVFLAKFCPRKLKGALAQLISLFAGIPSVIFGLFGMVVLVPALKVISPNHQGQGLLASSIILGMMILPTVLSISRTNIESVPDSVYDGAVALGCTHSQAVFKAVLPAAKSGIVTSVILGVGRAIGETMAIIMVVGNAAQIPGGLFENFRTLTVNIVLEMSYAEGLHRQSLIATGFVLLIFVLIINVLFNLVKNKSGGRKREKSKRLIKPGQDTGGREAVQPPVFRARPVYCRILMGVSVTLFAVSVAALLALVMFILVKGIPYLNFNFLFGPSGNGRVSLAPAFVSTFWLILITLVIAVPIGVFAAVFLVEYTSKKSRLVSVIRTFTETLAGVPSIVFGLFGMILFVQGMGMGVSLIAGALTLVLIVLPTIIRSTEEALLAVPDSLREGSLALGASKVRTIFKVVLPCAVSGIMTSVILSVGRIVGESAALIFTAGAVIYMPSSPLSMGSSFAVMVWKYMSEGLYIDQAYATAVVLLLIVVVLNFASFLAEKKLRKKY